MPIDRSQLTQLITWLSVLTVGHPDPKHRTAATLLAGRLSQARFGLAFTERVAPAADGQVGTLVLSTLNCLDIIAALDDVLELVDADERPAITHLQMALDLAIPYSDATL